MAKRESTPPEVLGRAPGRREARDRCREGRIRGREVGSAPGRSDPRQAKVESAVEGVVEARERRGGRCIWRRGPGSPGGSASMGRAAGARVRRSGACEDPLPYVYDVHPRRDFRPFARSACGPSIRIHRRHGRGGATQRGADFPPPQAVPIGELMQRCSGSGTRCGTLQFLPPIDVCDTATSTGCSTDTIAWPRQCTAASSADRRNVVELVPPGSRASEPPGSLAHVLTGTRHSVQPARVAARARSSRSTFHAPDEDAPPANAPPLPARLAGSRRPFAGRDGRPIRFLAASDERMRHSSTRSTRRRSADRRVIGCGDLEPNWLSFLADAFHAPRLRAGQPRSRRRLGGTPWRPGRWARQRDELDGIAIAGLDGRACTDEAITAVTARLGPHPPDRRAFCRGEASGQDRAGAGDQPRPPAGAGDSSDAYHRGFAAYRC